MYIIRYLSAKLVQLSNLTIAISIIVFVAVSTMVAFA